MCQDDQLLSLNLTNCYTSTVLRHQSLALLPVDHVDARASKPDMCESYKCVVRHMLHPHATACHGRQHRNAVSSPLCPPLICDSEAISLFLYLHVHMNIMPLVLQTGMFRVLLPLVLGPLGESEYSTRVRCHSTPERNFQPSTTFAAQCSITFVY